MEEAKNTQALSVVTWLSLSLVFDLRNQST